VEICVKLITLDGAAGDLVKNVLNHVLTYTSNEVRNISVNLK